MGIRTEIHSLRAARGDVVRAVLAWILVIAGLALVTKYGPVLLIKHAGLVFRRENYGGHERPLMDTILSAAGAFLVLVPGIYAARRSAGAVTKAIEAHLGPNRGGPVGFLTVIVGYVIVLLAFLQSGLGLHLGNLLLGGAFAGVLLGIAAQQSLANFFAGIILLAVRPFSIGDEVVIRSGALGGEYSGIVTGMSIFYVTMLTDQGRVSLPNAGVLSAAIGPGARAPQTAPIVKEDKEDDEAEEDAREGAGGGDGDLRRPPAGDDDAQPRAPKRRSRPW